MAILETFIIISSGGEIVNARLNGRFLLGERERERERKEERKREPSSLVPGTISPVL